MSITRLDYCQDLLVSQLNYTLTNSWEPSTDYMEGLSHNTINRYLAEAKLTLRVVWDNVREQVITSSR